MSIDTNCVVTSIAGANVGVPDGCFSLKGGCNCQAIRFRIHVPAFNEREINFYSRSRTAGRFPMTVFCHCNDCRRGTGTILPTYICTPPSMVRVSVLDSNLPHHSGFGTTQLPEGFLEAPNFISDAGYERNSHCEKPADNDARRGPWLSPTEVLVPGHENSKNSPYLRFYESGNTTVRTFCGRCGNFICYSKHPWPHSLPIMYDINLALVDKEDLQSSSLKPQQEVFSDLGIDWVKDIIAGTAPPTRRSPLGNIDELVGTPRERSIYEATF